MYCFFGNIIYFHFFYLLLMGKLKGKFWEEIVNSQRREAKIPGMPTSNKPIYFLSLLVFEKTIVMPCGINISLRIKKRPNSLVWY